MPQPDLVWALAQQIVDLAQSSGATREESMAATRAAEAVLAVSEIRSKNDIRIES